MVTFKNVHSLLDRNIIRCPNKNVERSLAKYSSSRSLQSDTKSDSEGVHHGVGVIIVSLKRRSKVYKVLGVTESEYE